MVHLSSMEVYGNMNCSDSYRVEEVRRSQGDHKDI